MTLFHACRVVARLGLEMLLRFRCQSTTINRTRCWT